MGAIDDFIRQTVVPHLRQGEYLVMTGYMEAGDASTSTQSHALLGVTTQRLVAIDCGNDVITGGPKAASRSITMYEYAQLTGVLAVRAVGVFPRKRFKLDAHGAPPLTGYVPRASQGVDGQGDLFEVFPEWVARHVQGGAFRSQEGWAYAQAELGNIPWLRAQAAAHDQAARIAAHTNRSIKWPYVVLVLLVLAAGVPALGLHTALGQARFEREAAERHRRDSPGITPAANAPGTPAGWLYQAEQRAEKYEARVAVFIPAIVVLLLAAGGMFVVGRRVNARKRAELVAQGHGA